MPPFHHYRRYKKYGSHKKHGDRWLAQRPHMGKNAMWEMVTPKQRDNQRGRWKVRLTAQKDTVVEIIRGYVSHITLE